MDTGSPAGSPKFEKRGIMFRERSKAWLPITRRSQDASKSAGFDQHRSALSENGGPSSWGLTIDLPPPPSAPFTMAQSQTPGWNSPWTPRVPNQPFSQEEQIFGRESDDGEKTMTRRKKLRTFILTNAFVPLVSLAHRLAAFPSHSMFPVVPIYQHYVYDLRTWRRYPNTKH